MFFKHMVAAVLNRNVYPFHAAQITDTTNIFISYTKMSAIKYKITAFLSLTAELKLLVKAQKPQWDF